jgi:ribose transport system substrate-binding protein
MTIKRADGDNIQVGFVTNCQASFWVIAQAGCEAAAKENGVECVFRAPTSGSKAEEQSRILEEMITNNVSGVAITPIDPKNQTQILNAAAKEMNLITQDSDAPDSNRLAYIGMSNYDAGRMCGELIKEALPEGGQVILFVGQLGQLNADQRRQGIIDELLDRSVDPERPFDSGDAVLKGDKYEIVDTRTDDTDEVRAKSNAEDAIAKYPDIDCMVGLFAYNPTQILEALKGAGKLGEIKVVGFDEEDATLRGIQDGYCYGTIVQNPYEYGYRSVKLLAQLASGDESALPESGYIDIPARAIRQDNVDEFWAELKQLTGQDAKDAAK